MGLRSGLHDGQPRMSTLFLANHITLPAKQVRVCIGLEKPKNGSDSLKPSKTMSVSRVDRVQGSTVESSYSQLPRKLCCCSTANINVSGVFFLGKHSDFSRVNDSLSLQYRQIGLVIRIRSPHPVPIFSEVLVKLGQYWSRRVELWLKQLPDLDPHAGTDVDVDVAAAV